MRMSIIRKVFSVKDSLRLASNSRSICCSAINNDVVTHTGQKWDDNDQRQSRFELSPKQVNKNWSMNLIKEVPVKVVTTRKVACDGGPEKSLGHPKIIINLDQPGPHSCIYCGLRYEMKHTH